MPQVKVRLRQLAGVAVDAPLEVEAVAAPLEAAEAPDDAVGCTVHGGQHAPVRADDGHGGDEICGVVDCEAGVAL